MSRLTERHWWKGTPGTSKTHIQRFGRSLGIITPILWRWFWSIRIVPFPSGPWLLGIQAGKDTYDEEPFFRLGLGPLLLVDGQCVVWMTYAEYDERMDRLEEIGVSG